MLGAIIGDIVGSTRERHNVKTEDFELVPAGSRFTDDTVMTLAVAKWLMADDEHHPETLVKCMQEMGRKYPHAGYGRAFSQWLKSDNPSPYNSFGNGSAMRVSPVGLYADSLKEAVELARIAASVSHNHPEGIKGAQAIAACVYLKKNKGFGAGKEIRRFIKEEIGYNLDFELEYIRDTYRFDVTCQGSVPIAIKAFLEHEHDPEKALRLAISMGGDSDTIGAMTASIANAHNHDACHYGCGFNEELEDKCRKLLPIDLRDINDHFEKFIRCSLPKNIEDRTRDRIRGSLIAGAAGDALGYIVEFMSRDHILAQYGRSGITKFDLSDKGRALISDDTQMTLFTANGMLMGITRFFTRGIGAAPEQYVRNAYMDWYYTQTGKKSSSCTWICKLPEMAHRRAPGNTCLMACESMYRHKSVQNNSKGCGGIMRVAPMALFMAGYWSRGHSPYTIPQMDAAGASIAEVTHKHPLGFLPAAMMTHLIFQLIRLDETEIKSNIASIALDSIKSLDNIYVGQYEDDKHYLANLTVMAVALAGNDKSDAENIRHIGEGWTGEEAWAIALYCTVRHIDDIEAAIMAAVNHDGDSDSTGAICGNIMGAVYGYEAIKRMRLFCPPGKELEQTLELSEIILAMADDLYTSCIIGGYEDDNTPEKRQWFDRYCVMIPAGIRVCTIERIKEMADDNEPIIYFWGHTPNQNNITAACLSQWFDCSFEVDGIRYQTAEQFMMASKARLFGDDEILTEIMDATTPAECKRLGRKIRGFVAERWDDKKYAIVVEGNMAKFSQNHELKEFLLSTGNAILAEASPYDTIWGIGLDKEHAEKVGVKGWQGENLLGRALMQVRDYLR